MSARQIQAALDITKIMDAPDFILQHIEIVLVASHQSGTRCHRDIQRVLDATHSLSLKRSTYRS